MTLHRQLILIVFALFLIVFTGTFYISIQNVRNYLNNQLISHAQDTATSLGLSLSPHIQKTDMATINSMVDAVFDRGDYRLIEIIDVNDKTLLRREIPVVIHQVPNWFVKFIPIDTPAGEALLMSGWSQAATIYVRSHPGYAYFELWQNAKQTLVWFLLTGLSIWLLGYITLRSMLRPLRHVEQQAEAICSREYPIQEELPWTRELRSVVMAMNKMVMRVKEMFQEQAELTDRLRNQAYRDPVTGLGNRTHFLHQFESRVASQEELEKGALFMVQIAGLQALNQKQGLETGDQLLNEAAKALRSSFESHGDCLMARLTGSDFIVLVDGMSRDEAHLQAEKCAERLKELSNSGLLDTDEVAHIGVVVFQKATQAGELLAQADHALRIAQADGPNAVAIESLQDTVTFSASDWRETLEAALHYDRLHFAMQPVQSTDGKLLHQELFARIQDEQGETYSAGVFVPMAIRHQMADQLDLAIIKKLLSVCQRLSPDSMLAVNLSAAAINNQPFRLWLFQQLNRTPDVARRLVFEISEYNAASNLEATQSFAEELKRLGSHFALDHFGRGFNAFGFLSSLPVAYVKLDGSLTRELQGDAGQRFYLESLIRTLHSIDVPVIAESIEQAEQKRMLADLAVNGFQGYYIGRPEPIAL